MLTYADMQEILTNIEKDEHAWPFKVREREADVC
jgi:hypothetical protein